MARKIKTKEYYKKFAVITRVPAWDGIEREIGDDDFDYSNSGGNLYDAFVIGLPCDEDKFPHSICEEIGGKEYLFVEIDAFSDQFLKKIKGDDEFKRLSIRVKNFELGEILILDDYGREIGGRGRKPSKWFVEHKEFDSLDEAIECAIKVQNRQRCD